MGRVSGLQRADDPRMAYDEKTANRVRRILAERPNVTERKMMGTLGFVVDGALCCCVRDNALMVRVSAAQRDAALAGAHVKPATLRGRIMKSFVLVEAAGIETHAALSRWTQRALGGARGKSTPAARAVKGASSASDRKFSPVIAAFAGDPSVTAGKMMASMGLKVNGKIFAMMSRGKFVAKLPKARVDELVQSGAGVYFDPRRDGRCMKEWIELAGTKPSWVALAKEAHRFVSKSRR